MSLACRARAAVHVQTTAPLETIWIRAEGYRVHARAAAPPVQTGRVPVVLVHGLMVSGLYLLPLARCLARDFPVYVPDLPGFGSSGKPRRALDLPQLADVLAAWLHAVGEARAAFVGHSFGCQIATELAVRHPGLVERIVLAAPTTDPEGRSVTRQIGRLARNTWREPPALMLIMLRDYWRAGAARTLRTFRCMMADAIEHRLPCVHAPALVVRGANDPIAPQRWAERVARLLPQGELAVLPGHAHAAHYSAPLEMARLLRPFLLECGVHDRAARVPCPRAPR